MIQSKKDLHYYLQQDRLALNKETRKPKVIAGEADLIWKYQIALRKCEYYTNCKPHSIRKYYFRYRLSRLGIKLGYSIPINVFDAGLSIAHAGTIIVNSHTKVGKNYRIQTGVTLGSTNGNNNSPIIGNNVFIGDGAKIIGQVHIADDISIAANAVVVKSELEPGITIGGIPAHKLSDNDSHKNLSPQLKLGRLK